MNFARGSHAEDCLLLVERCAPKMLNGGSGGGTLERIGLTKEEERSLTRLSRQNRVPASVWHPGVKNFEFRPFTVKRYLPFLRARLADDRIWSRGEFESACHRLGVSVSASKAFFWKAFGTFNPTGEAISSLMLMAAIGGAVDE